MFPPFLNYAPAFYADRKRDRCLSFAHSAESQCDGMSAGGEADAASRRGRGQLTETCLGLPLHADPKRKRSRSSARTSAGSLKTLACVLRLRARDQEPLPCGIERQAERLTGSRSCLSLIVAKRRLPCRRRPCIAQAILQLRNSSGVAAFVRQALGSHALGPDMRS